MVGEVCSLVGVAVVLAGVSLEASVGVVVVGSIEGKAEGKV